MSDDAATVRVPAIDRAAGALFGRWPALGERLAAWESRAARAEDAFAPIDRPVYVCGLARAGSTVLLDMLAAAPGFAAHRYGDYPGLWTPWWWQALRARLPRGDATPRERAHGDRLAVTRDSPEALEEVFWQHFFPHRHDPAHAQVLEAKDRSPRFDAFYRDHVGKLLHARGATRYVAKANYHLTRIGYLADLFPDARIVIPWREPVAHVGSLVRQDARFRAFAARDPAIATHLRRIGHREFGPDKRAIHVGDAGAARDIQHAFDRGDVVTGYALQWRGVHAWLVDRLASDAALAARCHLVPYDALCASPADALAAVFAHVDVDPTTATALTARFAPTISAPAYYDTGFEAPQRQKILAVAGDIVGNLTRLTSATRKVLEKYPGTAG